MLNLRRRKWAGSLRPWLALSPISSITCGLPALPLVQRWQLGASAVLAQEPPNAGLAEADQLRQQGTQQFNRRQTQQALETFQHELELRRQLGDLEGKWISLGWIGLIYQQFGQYQQALDRYQEGLRIAQTSEDSRGEGVMFNNIGFIYNNLKTPYIKWFKIFQEALFIGQHSGQTVEIT